ncbi:2-haloacid dehalogenase [Saccharomonospora amisosensis]|uniref:2-haloacid dehalogenase n=1 Tax=Saccharomonospora amisosensis TaxID=1128677 RepID=A0A7X5UPV7_9PSEU|nr:haloacid dehalogenase [Saccharomonospora amisosensis]NIJ11707.1 2-haloacid dehalogenase [Saccharomonospora amisosensis]
MTRARARKPRAILFDVLETLVRLEPLRERFVEVGRPEHELELFFARTLRDGMAYTLSGEAPPFREVAAAQLALTSGHTLNTGQIEYVLDGFTQLPLQPDGRRALDPVSEAGVPAYGFTHGSADVLERALEREGLRDRIVRVLSTREIGIFKPPARAYHWACERTATRPEATALVAVHSWDTSGAARAGLLAGFATRLEGRLPTIAEPPHVTAEGVDEVVADLLALPD